MSKCSGNFNKNEFHIEHRGTMPHSKPKRIRGKKTITQTEDTILVKINLITVIGIVLTLLAPLDALWKSKLIFCFLMSCLSIKEED